MIRGIARNLQRGTKERVWAEVPQWGPGAESPVGVSAKPPEAGDTC